MAKAAPPPKTCAACCRPFAWRRKWARDWEQVRFCSDACRTGRRARAVALRDARTVRGVQRPLDGGGALD